MVSPEHGMDGIVQNWQLDVVDRKHVPHNISTSQSLLGVRVCLCRFLLCSSPNWSGVPRVFPV